MNAAEKSKLKKSLDAQIAKLKLPTGDAKIVKKKIVKKVENVIDEKIDDVKKIKKPAKIKKEINKSVNKIIEAKTDAAPKVPDKIVENVEKVIDKKIDDIVYKKIVKKSKRAKILKFNYFKNIKDFKSGQLVKIGCEQSDGWHEAIWVVIKKINGNSILGKIDNNLKRSINCKNYNDTIKFTLSNIYDVYKG